MLAPAVNCWKPMGAACRVAWLLRKMPSSSTLRPDEVVADHAAGRPTRGGIDVRGAAEAGNVGRGVEHPVQAALAADIEARDRLRLGLRHDRQRNQRRRGQQ